MKNQIGRTVSLRHKSHLLWGIVLDQVGGTNRIKRVRIQSKGRFRGKVLMPSEYSVLEFDV